MVEQTEAVSRYDRGSVGQQKGQSGIIAYSGWDYIPPEGPGQICNFGMLLNPALLLETR